MISFTTYQNADAVLIKLLKKLSVKADPDLIEHELSKHPEYPSMLAMCDVLTTLGIPYSAFRIAAEELDQELCPFIAHTTVNGGEFLVVNRITGEGLTVSNEKWTDHLVSTTDFGNIFSGGVLVVEPDERNIMGKLSLARIDKSDLVVVGLLLLLLMGAAFNTPLLQHLSWQLVAAATVKAAGVCVSVLLLIQAIDSNNPLVQRLCVRGPKQNCNAVLSSNAAVAFMGITWSEIGFFYFTGTWLLLIFGGLSPNVLKVLTVLNLLSLPYTFYSVYYQASVAKQWCILCCTIQALLWLECMPLLNFHAFNVPSSISPKDLSSMLICLLLPVFAWYLVKPVLVKLQQAGHLKQLRKFKYNDDVFHKFLHQQPKYVLPAEEWSIVLGNIEAANIITVVTNPYCPPCADIHKMLDEWLSQNDNLQVRVIFAAENKDGDKNALVDRHLMALNEYGDRDAMQNSMHAWYQQKVKNYDKWAADYPVQVTSKSVAMLDKQKSWIEMAGVAGTPTLFVNGYLLPAAYHLSDIKYMLI